jgi:hypothetical protein
MDSRTAEIAAQQSRTFLVPSESDAWNGDTAGRQLA